MARIVGEDDAAPPIAPTNFQVSAWKPLVDKVGVPLMWFGLGYIACSLMSSRKAYARIPGV